MNRIGQTQRYRGHEIVRTHAGYSVQHDGAHICTQPSYKEAVEHIDARWFLARHEMMHRLWQEFSGLSPLGSWHYKEEPPDESD